MKSGSLDRFIFGAACALLLLTSQGFAQQVMSYYTGPTDSGTALHSFYGYLNMISTDMFTIDKSGNLTGYAPTSDISFATSKGISSFMCVSNYGTTDFDGTIADAILNSSSIEATPMVASISRRSSAVTDV